MAGPEALTPAAHRALLQWMCDECCDCELLRTVLTQRMSAADTVKRTTREAVFEEKGKLRVRPYDADTYVPESTVDQMCCLLAGAS